MRPVRRSSIAPIGPVILTHMHPDHIYGAEVFAEAGAEIVAHRNLPSGVALMHRKHIG